MTPLPTRVAAIAVLCFAGGALCGQGVDDRPDRQVKDPELQLRINQAILKGVDYLRSAQREDGSWGWKNEAGTGGLTALALYALAASDVRSDDPAIERGLAWVEANDRFFDEEARYGTYSASMLVLALTRVDAGKHRLLVARCARRLVAGQLRNGQWTYTLYSGRTTAASSMKERRRAEAWKARTGDNSNSQFAVLALWSAEALGGYDVPRATWRRVESFYRETQLPSGLWSYRPPPVTTATPADQRPPAVQGKASMSAAGLVSHVYATASLAGGPRGLAGAREHPTATRGLEAFLADSKKWVWRDLYLAYAIERVGTVLAVPTEHWYETGAPVLVKMQQPDGAWRPKYSSFGDPKQVYETALALLFLSKATAPAITGGR